MTRRHAFTLVECLVTIAIVAILLALAIPSLASARRGSRVAGSLSNLHQIGGLLSMYANQNHDAFPATTEGRSYAISDAMQIAYPYWQVYFTWPAVVSPGLSMRDGAAVYISPFSTRQAPKSAWPPSYSMSTSVVGAPKLWTVDGVAGKLMEIGQTHASVRFASLKALAWDIEIPSPRGVVEWSSDADYPVPMLMADASASNRVPAKATDAFANPNEIAVRSLRLHNTPGGVEGRDFEGQ
jgi:prepilin-type N-terminal cleavage/methylation domain-containing protein